MPPSPRLVAALRAVGCVFAEEEAAEVERVLGCDGHDRVVAGRAAGVPLEHLLGVARYDGLDLRCPPGAFVPRARTLPLAHLALDEARRAGVRVVVDAGCGIGPLAAVLARGLPAAEVHACDVDPVALAAARANGRTHGFAVHAGDWLDALPATLPGRVGLVVAYLPHVPERRLSGLPRDLRDHEPPRAHAGGPDGLDPWRRLLDQAPRVLAPGGTLLTLVAAEQMAGALAAAAGLGAAEVAWRDPEEPRGDSVVLVRSGRIDDGAGA